MDLPAPPTVTADALHQPFDLVLLSCEAYDLDDAMASFAPAVGPQTAILPLLNGMRHLDALEARFGAERVLGGQCLISAVLDPDGPNCAPQRQPYSVLWRARRLTLPPRRGHRVLVIGHPLRSAPQRGDPARHVGKMGVHRDRRRNNLTDARDDR